VHGDVLHSTPVAVNYGGSTGVVVFYGANDGVFRAINANQPPVSSGAHRHAPCHGW
jgi:type IV pilus assembly protein PilY1